MEQTYFAIYWRAVCNALGSVSSARVFRIVRQSVTDVFPERYERSV